LRCEPVGDQAPQLLNALARARLGDPERRRDLAIGAMLEKALDEEIAGLLGQAFEQSLDGGEALARGQLRVQVGFAGWQPPSTVFRMDVYRPVVDERSTLRGPVFVYRQVTKDEKVKGAGIRHRTIMPCDEVEYPDGRSGYEVLRTFAATS